MVDTHIPLLSIIYKDNVLVNKFPYSDKYFLSFEYRPTSPGTYKVLVFLRDANGNVKTNTTEECVVNPAMPLEIVDNTIIDTVDLGVEDIYVYAKAVGGVKPYTYAYYIYKNNSIVQRKGYTSDSYFEYTPTSEGLYKATIFVKDATGTIKSATTNVCNVVDKNKLYVSASIYPSEATIGENLWGDINAEGGTGEYSYAYYVYKDNVLVKKNAYTGSSYMEYTPTSPGVYKITAFVKDTGGRTQSTTTNECIVVESNPLTVFSEIQVVESEDGYEIWGQNEVEGGLPPYSYAYYVYKDNVLVKKYAYQESWFMSHIPTDPGTYKFTVFVKDASGKIKYTTTNECNVVDKNKIYVSASIEQTEINYGESFWAYINAEGGKLPYSYAYYVYKDNSIVKKNGYTSYSYFDYHPTFPGKYKIMAFVKDANGTIQYTTTNECVVKEPDPLKAEFSGFSEAYLTGDEISAGILVTGGIWPYSYAYNIYKDNAVIETHDYAEANDILYNIKYKPTSPGTYKIMFSVKGGDGHIESIMSKESIVKEPDPLEAELRIPETCLIGDEVSARIYASGGRGQYKFAYNIYKDGVEIETHDYVEDSSWYNIKYKPASPGTYKIMALVKDVDGRSTSVTSNECIVKEPDPLEATLSIPETCLVGDEISGDIVKTGGRSPHSYAYNIYKDDVEIEKHDYTETDYSWYTINYKPTIPGTYKIMGLVKDADGRTASITKECFVVEPDPLKATLEYFPETCLIGNEISEYIGKTGGRGPYSYAYNIYKDDVEIEKHDYQESSYIKYKPTISGTYKFVAFVKDADGRTASITKECVVKEPDQLEAKLYNISETCLIGNEISGWIGHQGGRRPYSYAYNIYKDGVEIEAHDYQESWTIKYKPTIPGAYKFMAFVKDVDGRTASITKECVVKEPDPLKATLDYFSEICLIGDEISGYIHATGGRRPYSYAYNIYKDNVEIEKHEYVEAEYSYHEIKYKPTIPGAYKFMALVKDADGRTASITNECVVAEPDPLKATLDIPETCLIGNEITGYIFKDGGRRPYSYAYNIYKDNVEIATHDYSEDNDIKYKPTSLGIYKIEAHVKDADGRTASITKECFVVEPNPLKFSSIDIYKSSYNVGEIVYVIKGNAYVNGGRGPYSYAYNVYKDDVEIETHDYEESYLGLYQFEHRPASPGTYKIMAYVKDADGRTDSIMSDELIIE